MFGFSKVLIISKPMSDVSFSAAKNQNIGENNFKMINTDVSSKHSFVKRMVKLKRSNFFENLFKLKSKKILNKRAFFSKDAQHLKSISTVSKSILIDSNKSKVAHISSISKNARSLQSISNIMASTTTSLPPVFEKFKQLSMLNNEPQQFCGETLYYAVEYYCVYIKGTSVYVPETDVENINVINSDNNKTKKRNAVLNDETTGNLLYVKASIFN